MMVVLRVLPSELREYVPVTGIIDTVSNITIISVNLFKKVVTDAVSLRA